MRPEIENMRIEKFHIMLTLSPLLYTVYKIHPIDKKSERAEKADFCCSSSP